MNATLPHPARFNPWPWSIIGFFVLLICAIASYVVFATHQNLDLVRKDYYAEELRFQNRIDRLSRTTALGPGARAEYEPATQSLAIHLPSTHCSPQTKAVLSFYRPSNAALDHEVECKVTTAGIAPISLQSLAPGLWKTELNWTVDGLDYALAQSIIIPPGAK